MLCEQPWREPFEGCPAIDMMRMRMMLKTMVMILPGGAGAAMARMKMICDDNTGGENNGGVEGATVIVALPASEGRCFT